MTADEYIAQRQRVVSEAETIARYYRWWSVSASREHVKLGPVSITWYRWAIDVVLLCRYPLLRIGGLAL